MAVKPLPDFGRPHLRWQEVTKVGPGGQSGGPLVAIWTPSCHRLQRRLQSPTAAWWQYGPRHFKPGGNLVGLLGRASSPQPLASSSLVGLPGWPAGSPVGSLVGLLGRASSPQPLASSSLAGLPGGPASSSVGSLVGLLGRAFGSIGKSAAWHGRGSHSGHPLFVAHHFLLPRAITVRFLFLLHDQAIKGGFLPSLYDHATLVGSLPRRNHWHQARPSAIWWQS